MNASVKMMIQNRMLTQDSVIDNEENLILFLPELKILFLIIIVFISGLSLVYIKDLNRQLFIKNQNAMQNFSGLSVLHNKLLLEQSAWSKQDRVQTMAENQFDMQIPSVKDLVVIEPA